MTDSSAPRFHLIEEPWIPVRYLDGRTVDVSLRDAFRDAHRIREIGGEVATQTFALTRLLLAILYRATVDTEAGWSREAWQADWQEGLPVDLVDTYLDEYADRFWLLHQERPFFQVADLSTPKGEVKDTAPLILDLPSNNRLFTNRSGDASMRLPFAEAARWLVNAQSFDPSGIKSGAVGDSRVKGGKGYPIGIAWSGLLGGLLLEGSTLAQTLLLNFVVPGEVAEFTANPDTDLPPWENDESDTAAERPDLHPSGPVRLFTWQSRRIRLVLESDTIIGCVLTNGDALTPQNQFRHESMTAWRYSDPQSKKAGVPTFMPREHQPDRAFWRGIGALLPQLAASGGRTIPPATIEALGARQNHGVIPSDLRIGVRAIGVVYGSNNSVVGDLIDDRLTVSLALLRESNRHLAAEAENAVVLADEGVRALKNLAENLSRAAGGDGTAPRDRAEETAYAALDGHYRHWLARIDDDSDPAGIIAEWKTVAYREIRALGADLVRDAGPAAWAGREVRTRTGTEFITTPRAEGWFLRALHKTFGGAPQASTSGEEAPE